jgi:predicted  nucleic acid-binding Zn-ribbon protein
MYDLIFPYLGGMIVSAIVLFLGGFNYIQGRKERFQYERERALLPDAVRLEKLIELKENAQEEYDDIQERLADARVMIAERDEANDWLAANREKLLQLKAEREEQEAVRLELANLQSKVADQLSAISNHQASIAGIQAELLYHEKIRSQKQEEILAIESAKAAVVEEKLSLEKELEPLQVRLAGIESQIAVRKDELQQVATSLETRNRQLEERLNQAAGLIKESEDKLDKIREQANEANSTLAERQARANVAKSELEQLERHKSDVTGELRKLDESIANLNKKKLQLEASLNPLEVKLSGIQSNIEVANQELVDVRTTMEKRIVQYEQQISESKERFDLNEKKLAGLQKQLDGTTNELHAARDERSRLSADVQALQREKVALEDLIKNLRADWNTVLQLTGRDEGAEERRTQELWQPYVRQKASEFEKPKKKPELEFLDESEHYLRSQNLYFPKRVLRAFHTSLKVTDISPLVVLAGISGTGKSELPRRYAEAMGMHFLNVAVQPRWDSPQDMFGFFNYLENRYRATEVGRALVQMDPFYKEPDRGWTAPEDWDHSLSSQMLLVLLDEMNLARVEYYFSEFLSRLETRRGIDRNNPESRRKAEIGLEVGSGKNKTPIMQLFVDRNVLFVGTMNEDETTQSLSDKVVDRANVLRFGRPGNVEQSNTNRSSVSMTTRLDFAMWDSWCRSAASLSETTNARVLEHTNKLDEAMSEIKRPFGFRTRNSILSYVANYPSSDDDAVSDALADQIEQKILPKFRGLDARDTAVKSALGKIKGVLNELDDNLLIRAIDQSSKDGQFVWLGVNRFEEELSK